MRLHDRSLPRYVTLQIRTRLGSTRNVPAKYDRVEGGRSADFRVRTLGGAPGETYLADREAVRNPVAARQRAQRHQRVEAACLRHPRKICPIQTLRVDHDQLP